MEKKSRLPYQEMQLFDGRFEGNLMIDAIRQGEIDAHAVAATLTYQVMYPKSDLSLVGFSDAIVAALLKGK